MSSPSRPASLSMRVRPGLPKDGAALEAIEIAADALLIDHLGARDWPPPTSATERAHLPGFVLVAEAGLGTHPSTVGFANVLEVDGHAHLEQLSVLPSYGQRGIGRLLVAAALAEARDRGHALITLRTYADVPWNAPFYASCGFIESEPDSDFHRALLATEHALQLSQYGQRVQMTAVLRVR